MYRSDFRVNRRGRPCKPPMAINEAALGTTDVWLIRLFKRTTSDCALNVLRFDKNAPHPPYRPPRQ